ncbi:ppGpp synthetase catalytic domain-containing protein (RelA/SpoT-type nucleotidyltranferase) [Pedobacter steynii]|uniref:PpGpp synthetase catalytic domain-containing protein (RelA/SpoT-type nucleotidyltranferase) n=1 Tax=Pedobacter steynii TaxID=430522 RepID=A0A1G9UHX5_9SPHI|nr:hypothetical protein [Pedobacter steynii]NQX40773.1 hypothetical protein [Pedobacter steynii]SDM59519.1 ppGpp synthetase catalytic domain-containing protein (RelA/SpoT-type nucleotidyltranferase) [Pedobacter steynii]
MKVIQSIESAYEFQKELNIVLKNRVDEIMGLLRRDNISWHYFSRIKQLESFALKLETGRFEQPTKLEDFFACTLVVENLDQINRAKTLLATRFEIVSQKPKESAQTHKSPFSFEFDDLRIYVKLKSPEYLPPEPIEDIIFEIQIKTFLQHAWGLATHDLIYKADEINWSKERVAFQIKAMLEQAEVAISGINGLVMLPEILKESHETTSLKEIMHFYKVNFKDEELPRDVVRLCKNTHSLLQALRLNSTDLANILSTETSLGKGTNLRNLSPYLLIVQSIINQRKLLVERFFSGKKQRFKVLVPKELSLDGIKIGAGENMVKL